VILVVLWSGSVIGLTFIIERGLALREAVVMPPEVKSALETCRTEGDLPMLRRICQQHKSSLSTLLVAAESHKQYSRGENAGGLETLARHEISRLERGLVVLEIVVGTAPLLGLVGTIYGLITLFAGMGTSGLGDNSAAVGKGIALALNSTLLGLITAIPSLVAWSYYSKKIEHMAIEMASLCDGFLRQLYHHEDVGEPAEAPAGRRS
jgi:biopolymer transport protein ExbB